MKFFVLFMFVSFSAFAGLFDKYPDGKVTVRVIDEQGMPMKGVNVGIGVYFLKTMNPFDGKDSKEIEGKTDDKGFFTSEFSGLCEIIVWADAQGYYSSSQKYVFDEPVAGKYQPWNPTITLVLRKIKNPVPMYAKKAEYLVFPCLEEPVGYDFLIGDLVEPHGKGKVKDFIVTFKLEYEKEIDTRFGKSTLTGYQIEIKMPNKGDGFYPIPKEQIHPDSDFKWPYEAPEDGYHDKLLFIKKDYAGENEVKSKSSLEPDADYYFIRIRTEFDEAGKIKKAYYGRFLFPSDGNKFCYRKRWGVEGTFTYYINPDGSRNMEYDPEKNLFIPKDVKNKYTWEYEDYRVER